MIASAPNKQLSIAAAIAFAAIGWSSSAYSGEDLVGLARVIDGDTIAIGIRHVRFEGIDAPETDQVCLNAKGERWTCELSER